MVRPIFGIDYVVVPDHLLPKEHVGHRVNLIPISRHRSRRVFKKLCHRRRRAAAPIMQDQAFIIGNNRAIIGQRMDAMIRREFGVVTNAMATPGALTAQSLIDAMREVRF